MGGWIKLCQTLESDLLLKEHEFVKRYAFYFIYPPEAYPKALTGIQDYQNNQYGFGSDIPTYIGDVEKAKAVYLKGMVHPALGEQYTYEAIPFVDPKKNAKHFNNNLIH
jgi:hypothetical protein